MKYSPAAWSLFGIGCLVIEISGFPVSAAETTPPELEGVGIEEHLGTQVSPDLIFQNEEGELVRFEEFFKRKKPVLLALVYYECPNICNYLLRGATETLRKIPWILGREFEFVTVSIDPREKPPLAQAKKESYLKLYGRTEGTKGWHFLVGGSQSIQTLASQVGFQYRYDEEQKQYAHPAALVALTPSGKIARYLYGIDFSPKDLKLALLEASQGKIGNIMDKFLLFCYHYDPKGRKYALFATRLMQGGGFITMGAVGFFLWRLSTRRQPG